MTKEAIKQIAPTRPVRSTTPASERPATPSISSAPTKKSAKASPLPGTLAAAITDAVAGSETKAIAKSAAVRTETKTDLIKLPSELDNSRYRELSAEIDSIERSIGIDTIDLVQSGFVEHAISSGVLAYDFAVGGGVAPGRFSILPGLEGSGKSTVVDNLAAVCTLQGIPTYWFDAEAALDPNYAGRIFDKYGLRLRELMGIRDSSTNKWLVPPVIRYTQEMIGERIFKAIGEICARLPTVRQDRNHTWWKQIVVPGKAPKWEPDEYQGRPQYLFIVDSWPAVLTEARSADADKSPMAEQARMFSNWIKTIKAPISQKNCVLFSVNQLRTNPGVMFGSPIYEPGGAALKFFSDVRTEIMHVAPSTVKAGTGKYTEEPSVNGGNDQYVYAKIRNTKNKAFSPFRESVMRIRFTHDGAPGDGVCETYDVMQYLLATGQMQKSGQKLKMFLRPLKENGKNNPFFADGDIIPYGRFKEIVERAENHRRIYKYCLAQLRTGYAFEIERAAIRTLISSGTNLDNSLLSGPADEDFDVGRAA